MRILATLDGGAWTPARMFGRDAGNGTSLALSSDAMALPAFWTARA